MKKIMCQVIPTVSVPNAKGIVGPYIDQLSRTDVIHELYAEARVFRITSDGERLEVLIDDIYKDTETGEDLFAEAEVLFEVEKDDTMNPITVTYPDDAPVAVLAIVGEEGKGEENAKEKKNSKEKKENVDKTKKVKLAVTQFDSI